MRLKSFFANTVEEAIRQARIELGPEAMLVNSKPTGIEAKHLGAYEVVVCADAPEYAPEDADRARLAGRAGSPRGKLTARAAVYQGTFSPGDKLSQDVSDLKQQMEKLALTLARSGGGMAGIAFDAQLARAFTTLTDAELDTELAYDMVARLDSCAAHSQTGSPSDSLADLHTDAQLRAELAKLARVDSELGRPDTPARIVALVGPPGCGKTSTLVKLAVRYGVSARRPVRLLTADTYRIAAAEELRCYAAILGVGIEVLETPAALGQTLESRHQGLTLIDTPGLSRNEMDVADDWAKILAAHPGVDTHLVLPASMRTADLKRVAGQYSVFQPRKLLFTRLDETVTLGPILSLSIRMDKPISFFCAGQHIPEDLEPAAVDTLLDAILGRPEARDSKYGVVAA